MSTTRSERRRLQPVLFTPVKCILMTKCVLQIGWNTEGDQQWIDVKVAQILWRTDEWESEGQRAGEPQHHAGCTRGKSEQCVYYYFSCLSLHHAFSLSVPVCLFNLFLYFLVGGCKWQRKLQEEREGKEFTSRQIERRTSQFAASRQRAARDVWWWLVPQHAPAMGVTTGQRHQEVSIQKNNNIVLQSYRFIWFSSL